MSSRLVKKIFKLAEKANSTVLFEEDEDISQKEKDNIIEQIVSEISDTERFDSIPKEDFPYSISIKKDDDEESDSNDIKIKLEYLDKEDTPDNSLLLKCNFLEKGDKTYVSFEKEEITSDEEEDTPIKNDLNKISDIFVNADEDLAYVDSEDQESLSTFVDSLCKDIGLEFGAEYDEDKEESMEEEDTECEKNPTLRPEQRGDKLKVNPEDYIAGYTKDWYKTS